MDEQNSTLNDNRGKFKSKSVLKFSTVQTPNYIRHKLKTNLNLPPPNWLCTEEESYGIRYMTSRDFLGFSSFQMANMFHECIGKVDIISDAENIKNLCKIPYNEKSVSIMVHRIDKTLLLDEFDVQKYLIVETNNEWDWLKKFFHNNIVESSDKVKCITHKLNSLRAILRKDLVSKFLHHTVALNSQNDQIKNTMFSDGTSPLTSALPKISPEEVFPDSYQLFNRNFLWDFEGMQMLIGTDLPIFGSRNNSSLSPRLRDMSKPLRTLTGIDYWLDNLMCNIPETELCYHINGIVQKYELVKTGDLPCLSGPAFSPKSVSDIMQNTLSFLKSNAKSVGHTYWLFKGKNHDVVKLYDLTTLCSESLTDSLNPFTVPMAILLYRFAYKLKYIIEDGNLYNPVTIQVLLNNCLQLLDKTKYPQIVTSINYMLSDMYISIYNNPSAFIVSSTDMEEDSATCYEDSAISSTQFDYGTYSVDIRNLCVPHKKENISLILENSMSKHSIKTLKECYCKALYYIGNSRSCLQYFKNDKDIMVERALLSKSKTIIPILYLDSEMIEKNNMSNWHNLPNAEDIRNHLCPILYKRASNAYFNLAEKYLTSRNFGTALKYFRRSLECLLCVTNVDVNHLFGPILDRCANCYLFILKHWDKIEQYSSELETDEKYDFELRKALLSNSNRTKKDLNLIPTSFNGSKEIILNAAEHCYLRALALETNINYKNNLSKQIGYVYNEYIQIYIDEILMAINNNIPVSPLKLKWLTKKSKSYCSLGRSIFVEIGDTYNHVMINSNSENLIQYMTQYSTKYYIAPINTFIKKEIFNFKVVNIYKKRLSEIGDRNSNSQWWDMVYFKLSSILFNTAVNEYLAICQCNSNNYNKCINLFMEALEYCDLEVKLPNKFVYEYRTAYIQSGLASLSSDRLEQCTSEELNSILIQIKSYCNTSYGIFFKIKRPLESFEVLIKMITLDMRLIGKTIGLSNLKYIRSIIETLRKCVSVFQMFSENKDTMKNSYITDQTEKLTIQDDLHFKMRKLHFLLILEENVLKLLKCMIQLTLDKSSVNEVKWLADKKDELKIIYSALLRNGVSDNNYSQLIITVEKLSTFK